MSVRVDQVFMQVFVGTMGEVVEYHEDASEQLDSPHGESHSKRYSKVDQASRYIVRELLKDPFVQAIAVVRLILATSLESWRVTLTSFKQGSASQTRF